MSGNLPKYGTSVPHHAIWRKYKGIILEIWAKSIYYLYLRSIAQHLFRSPRPIINWLTDPILSLVLIPIAALEICETAHIWQGGLKKRVPFSPPLSSPCGLNSFASFWSQQLARSSHGKRRPPSAVRIFLLLSGGRRKKDRVRGVKICIFAQKAL